LTHARKSHRRRRGQPAEPTPNGLFAKARSSRPSARSDPALSRVRSTPDARPSRPPASCRRRYARCSHRPEPAGRPRFEFGHRHERRRSARPRPLVIAERECLVDCTYRSPAGRERVVIQPLVPVLPRPDVLGGTALPESLARPTRSLGSATGSSGRALRRAVVLLAPTPLTVPLVTRLHHLTIDPLRGLHALVILATPSGVIFTSHSRATATRAPRRLPGAASTISAAN
jgi:hypothetical protein